MQTAVFKNMDYAIANSLMFDHRFELTWKKRFSMIPLNLETRSPYNTYSPRYALP